MLLVIYLLHATIFKCWKHVFVFICAMVVLLSEPTEVLAGWLNGESAGMIAILGSFLLFALGSVAAFSKPKWWRSS